MLSIAWFLTQAGSPRAETIYRWIDEQGNPHFTRTPPTTSSFDKLENGDIIPDEEIEEASESEGATIDENSPEGQKAPTTEEKYSEQLNKLQSQKKQACEQARKNKQYLLNKHRIRMRQTDGSIRMLTREEKLKQLDAADQAIKANCD